MERVRYIVHAHCIERSMQPDVRRLALPNDQDLVPALPNNESLILAPFFFFHRLLSTPARPLQQAPGHRV